MFLRANKRFKDGKEHRYRSVVENRRVAVGRSVQKTLLYLGEFNDSDRVGWTRAIEAVDEREQARQIHLFPEDRTPDPLLKHPTLQFRLSHIELARPRQWGSCWLAMELWNRLKTFGYSRDKRPDFVQIVIALIRAFVNHPSAPCNAIDPPLPAANKVISSERGVSGWPARDGAAWQQPSNPQPHDPRWNCMARPGIHALAKLYPQAALIPCIWKTSTASCPMASF